MSPQNNPQMMLYALGALKLYRPIFGDTLKKVSMYIDQPRLNSYSGYSITVDELLAWGEHTVKPKAALAYMGMGEYAPAAGAGFVVLKYGAVPAQTRTPRWKTLSTRNRPPPCCQTPRSATCSHAAKRLWTGITVSRSMH